MRKLLLSLTAVLGLAGAAGAQCVSSITATPAPLNNDLLRYTYANTSSYGLPFAGQIRSFVYYYGDGTTASGSGNLNIPAHVYPAPGIYNTGLVIYSYDSASSRLICTDSMGLTVNAAYPACGTTIGISGTGATRSFTATTVGGNTGMSYSWTFGDGSTGTGATASHSYTTAGFYNVTLTATKTTPPSCSYTNTQRVYISLPPAPLNCASLSAGFTASVSANRVTTTNTSSTVPAPYVMVANWNYGDGGTATGLNPPPHTYSSLGVYTITLSMVWRDSLSLTYCADTQRSVIAVTSMPTPTNVISGEVRYDSLTYGINNFKVWLIRLDSASNTLYAVDSQITGNTANAYYAFGNKPAGVYRTKAAVYLGSTSGAGLIPTYHDSSTYWNVASQIYHYGGSSTGRNIYMRSGTVTSGPGFIGGNISLGANKGTANGVRGMMVFLRDRNEKAIAMTYTDSFGNYAFRNLARGAYSIYPELMNIVTTPITPIVLSVGADTMNMADFSYDEARRSIVPRSAVSVTGCNCVAGIQVSPIPAHDRLNISWNGGADGESRFLLTNLAGQTVVRSGIENGRSGKISLDISNLVPGVYILHGSGALGGAVSRIVIR